MSSRNTLGIEGNALNLSLTGSQLSQRSVNNDRQNLQKKTPSYTNRVSSARSSNSVNFSFIFELKMIHRLKPKIIF